MSRVLEDQCHVVIPWWLERKTCMSLAVPTLLLQGSGCLPWAGGGAGHPQQAGRPENSHGLPPYHYCLVLLVISYCGRTFPALPASTPSVTASWPPTAPMATAKVTDDLLIARTDSYSGALIAAALSMAFEWADPFATPWLALAPGVCCSLTYCTPNLLYLCRLCFLISLWCSPGSGCMLFVGCMLPWLPLSL